MDVGVSLVYAHFWQPGRLHCHTWRLQQYKSNYQGLSWSLICICRHLLFLKRRIAKSPWFALLYLSVLSQLSLFSVCFVLIHTWRAQNHCAFTPSSRTRRRQLFNYLYRKGLSGLATLKDNWPTVPSVQETYNSEMAPVTDSSGKEQEQGTSRKAQKQI